MLEVGTKAPDFELPDQNGEMFYCLYNGHADITRMVEFT